MLAIEIDTEVTPDRAIHVQLPQGARTGRARVIVLYESEDTSRPDTERGQGNLDDLLAVLPRNVVGRDREEIAASVEAERASWD
ncbi:hypothetical protein [uncultured Thiodictyon sp.]|uniref:hypothetical protein n=1 Tax=uncultured Thiodictyon sp. TaxID=1846217 RepID=UPI0025FB5768|nr:hypothetical protein [uncultured Thiodictyon sp.]